MLIFMHLLRSIRCTQSIRAPRSRASEQRDPYSGLYDVTMRGLTLATLHHRGSAILIMLLQTPFLRRISARLSKE